VFTCDLANLMLTDLLALDASALGPALERLRREADEPSEALARFGSAV
jgi:FXSXX-COOH protein